ncbi:5395_t:CDS:1 [Diversispora eburnea]|uniref:5395_t:CDS:1 n=1 Tax=Diversispora eburnea TaxID=1213867 RepID=A0A9N8VC61_9GLOM|nr:5395_t:CDS:1 [Diversispora eburnea]
MAPPLPADCLDGILQHLHDDAGSLFSCMLVNRLWCKSVVPILWSNPWQSRQLLIDSTPRPFIVRTLLSCLSEESKQIFKKNGIVFSTQTSRYPLFDYVGYCQYLSPSVIDIVKKETVGDNNESDLPRTYRETLVEQEFYKMFMARTYLKSLVLPKIPLSYCPGANVCLEKLRELKCHTDCSPELYYGLAQISRNILKLNIYPCDEDNEGLIALIKLQNGLQSLVLKSSENFVSECPRMGFALKTQAHSLKYIKIRKSLCISPTILSSFVNLRILQLDLTTRIHNMEQFANIYLPKLEILDIFRDENTPFNIYIRFIENVSQRIQRIYWESISLPKNSSEIRKYLQVLSLSSATLKFITIWWDEDCMDILYHLLISCHKLEAIRICCPIEEELSNKGNKIFEILKKAAPRNLSILNLHIKWAYSDIVLQDFLESWRDKNQISLYLPYEIKLLINCDVIIRRYREEGVLKDFQYVEDTLYNVYSLRDLWNHNI